MRCLAIQKQSARWDKRDRNISWLLCVAISKREVYNTRNRENVRCNRLNYIWPRDDYAHGRKIIPCSTAQNCLCLSKYKHLKRELESQANIQKKKEVRPFMLDKIKHKLKWSSMLTLSSCIFTCPLSLGILLRYWVPRSQTSDLHIIVNLFNSS